LYQKQLEAQVAAQGMAQLRESMLQEHQQAMAAKRQASRLEAPPDGEWEEEWDDYSDSEPEVEGQQGQQVVEELVSESEGSQSMEGQGGEEEVVLEVSTDFYSCGEEEEAVGGASSAQR
jgi:hypothetical protein